MQALHDLAIRLRRRSVDRLLVPLENRVLDAYARRCPERLGARIDRAIDRGMAYFEGIDDWELDSLFALRVFVDDRYDSRLSMTKKALEQYRKTWKDPLIRTLDHDYDPERDGASCLKTYEPPIPRDDLMIRCVYADRNEAGVELLTELEALEDGGGYGTTHILLGCILLRWFSNIDPARLQRTLDATIAPILRAQARDRSRDLFFERIVFLQSQGYSQEVRPAWIMRVLRSQQSDGGWFRRKPPFRPPSEQHPSCLALVALLRFRSGEIGVRSERVTLAGPTRTIPTEEAGCR